MAAERSYGQGGEGLESFQALLVKANRLFEGGDEKNATIKYITARELLDSLGTKVLEGFDDDLKKKTLDIINNLAVGYKHAGDLKSAQELFGLGSGMGNHACSYNLALMVRREDKDGAIKLLQAIPENCGYGDLGGRVLGLLLYLQMLDLQTSGDQKEFTGVTGLSAAAALDRLGKGAGADAAAVAAVGKESCGDSEGSTVGSCYTFDGDSSDSKPYIGKASAASSGSSVESAGEDSTVGTRTTSSGSSVGSEGSGSAVGEDSTVEIFFGGSVGWCERVAPAHEAGRPRSKSVGVML